ncbi:MAG: isoprenylcysteine carboxylmethyltransferase family protein [Nanoarchaeota archaeon]|nr:isoprenylcysteine carboxylmethyltransferase family protein [Nanoarchaeota archaeon]
MKLSLTPDYFLGFIALQIILHYAFPVVSFISYPFIYLGIPLILFGLYLNLIWVAYNFRKEKTTIRPFEIPNKLVTYGPFRYSRNPTYLGMALTLLGISIFLGSLATFIIPLIFVILTDTFTIPIEEKNLNKKFGKKYLDYQKRVRRWI